MELKAPSEEPKTRASPRFVAEHVLPVSVDSFLFHMYCHGVLTMFALFQDSPCRSLSLFV